MDRSFHFFKHKSDFNSGLCSFFEEKTGPKYLYYTFWLCFHKKELITLLKRAKKRFDLFCPKTSDSHEKPKSKFPTLKLAMHPPSLQNEPLQLFSLWQVNPRPKRFHLRWNSIAFFGLRIPPRHNTRYIKPIETGFTVLTGILYIQVLQLGCKFRYDRL